MIDFGSIKRGLAGALNGHQGCKTAAKRNISRLITHSRDLNPLWEPGEHIYQEIGAVLAHSRVKTTIKYGRLETRELVRLVMMEGRTREQVRELHML